jgi:hypothetical protein
MNLAVGVATGAAMALCGMGDPVLRPQMTSSSKGVAWRTTYHVEANWIELSYEKCDHRLPGDSPGTGTSAAER